MDSPAAELIALIAGAAMGFINNLAGAGGVIGLLVFDLVFGLTPETANASLRPSAFAIGISGMLGFLSRRQEIPLRAWLYALCAIPGAALGAVLAVELPVVVYQLSLLAIITLLLGQQLRHRTVPGTPPGVVRMWVSIVLFSFVGLHMGFLQVGTGLILIATLGRVHSRDLLTINAAKMAVVFATSATSTIYFAATDSIAWEPALWIAVGAGAGSFLASRWSVKRGHAAIRTAVLIISSLCLVRIATQVVF